jgi:hypothetical protein
MERAAIFSNPIGSSRKRENPVIENIAASAIKM